MERDEIQDPDNLPDLPQVPYESTHNRLGKRRWDGGPRILQAVPVNKPSPKSSIMETTSQPSDQDHGEREKMSVLSLLLGAAIWIICVLILLGSAGCRANPKLFDSPF